MIQFDRFSFDPDRLELREAGTLVPLAPQPLALLTSLLAEPGRMVSRDELRLSLWPDGTTVDFDAGLNFVVSQLRRALGDHAQSPRFIETVPRRGYRFIGEVRRAETAGAPGAVGRPAWRRIHPLWLGLLVVGLLVAGAGLTGLMQQRSSRSVPIRLVVLAVRPLLEDDALAALAGGLTADLRVHLGGLAPDRIQVLGGATTNSTAAAAWTASDWRAHVGADYLLDGTLRGDRGRLRVTLELVDTGSGAQVWSAAFDRGARDLGTTQPEIAAAVASAVSVRVADRGAQPATSLRWPDDETAEIYLRGRLLEQLVEQEASARAHVQFAQVVERAPGDARGWAGVARTARGMHMDSGLSRAEAARVISEAVDRALAADPNSTEALAARGMLELWYQWDLAGAATDLAAAATRNPSTPSVHHDLGWTLLARGDVAAGLLVLERGAALEPLSAPAVVGLAWAYLRAGRYDDAVRAAHRTLALRPDHAEALFCLARAEHLRGDDAASVSAIRRLLHSGGAAARELGASLGDMDPGRALATYLRWLLDLWETSAPSRHAYGIASLHALLGQDDQALDWLQRSLESREVSMLTLPLDPVFRRLASHPRFRRLVEALPHA